MNTAPEWAQPGCTVLIQGFRGPGGRDPWWGEGKVERLTPTQIILTNGRRYRIRDLREVGYASTLYPPDDPGIRRRYMRYRKQRELADLTRRIRTISETWQDPDDETLGREIIRIVTEHLNKRTVS